MRLNLPHPSKGIVKLVLDNDRIPTHIESIESAQCQYELEKHPDHYRLNLTTTCQLTLTCQRCMEDFGYTFHNTTLIGLCDNDTVAERIMDDVEPVVLNNNDIPFETIVIDELHLYLPQFHLDETECQQSMLAE